MGILIDFCLVNVFLQWKLLQVFSQMALLHVNGNFVFLVSNGTVFVALLVWVECTGVSDDVYIDAYIMYYIF